MKSIILITLLSASVQAFGIENSISELLKYNINSVHANFYAKKNGKYYDTKNWLNPVLHNIFMANNRSETGQFRNSLSQVAQNSKGRLSIIDLLGDRAIDWQNINEDIFQKQVRQFHSLAAIDTQALAAPRNERAPFVVMFSSASHNLLSILTMQAPSDIANAGFIPVLMEYPGYGASMGAPNKANWQIAAEGLVRFLHRNFPGHPIFLYGHSIGGAVALETGAKLTQLVAGVVSHATFYDLKEASKDSSQFLLSDIIAPIVATLLAYNENWDGEENLQNLAKNSVPVLVMHGRNDASVSVRHLSLFSNQAEQLQKIYPKFNFAKHEDDSSHEDMNASDAYGPYSQLWRRAFDFIETQMK